MFFFCLCRSQGNCPLSFHQFCVHMNVIKSKFEVRDSQDYYHMTFIGKTTYKLKRSCLAFYSQRKWWSFSTKWLILHLMHLFFIKTCGNSERRQAILSRNMMQSWSRRPKGICFILYKLVLRYRVTRMAIDSTTGKYCSVAFTWMVTL